MTDRVSEVLAALGVDPDQVDPDVLDGLRKAAATEDPIRQMTRRLFGRDQPEPDADDPPAGSNTVRREGHTSTPTGDDADLRRLTRHLFGNDPDLHGGS